MNLHYKIVSNETEFNSFKEAIQIAGLPHEDLNYNNQVLVSYLENDVIIGTGGLEVINQCALLRSVSVSHTCRKQNIGKKITSDLLQHARQSNLKEIYLLTETAKDYFQKLGFEEVNRNQVPDEIKSTTEFASVCPTSATCMMMKLN